MQTDIGTSLGNIRPPKPLPIVFPAAVTLLGFTATCGITNTEVTDLNLKLIKANAVFGTSYTNTQIGSDHTVATSSTTASYEITDTSVNEDFAVDEGLFFVIFPTGTLTTDRFAHFSITLNFKYQ